MKTKLTLSIILTLLSTSALGNSQKSGTVYICADIENTTKLTLDLSDNKMDQSAVISVDGLKHVYHSYAKELMDAFWVARNKNVLFRLKKSNSESQITLVTHPETLHSTVLHEYSDLVIRRFNASLSASDFHPAHHDVIKINNVDVACTETKWKY